MIGRVSPAMLKHARWLAILDTMYGDSVGKAHSWFPINPENHSGKRLYDLTNCEDTMGIWITNACPQKTKRAKDHGKPDPRWLYDNLKLLTGRLQELPLLICGEVAQTTFENVTLNTKLVLRNPCIELAHPAARNWSAEKLLETREMLEGYQ